MIAAQKKVIVAPLNWGLGHASRCIPIIHKLLESNFFPIIASDGKSLTFLQKEFPDLEVLQLPSYQIKYGKNLKLNLVLKIPKIWKAVLEEKNIIQKFTEKHKDVVGIISDNRFGVRSKAIPSVYITHQLNVLSGLTTVITSKIHQNIIKKFDECWIPDTENCQFSGKLSSTNKNLNQKYIGVLSRFKKQDLPKEIDVLVILSGPEPNRTKLESTLIKAFKNCTKKVVFVLGKVGNQQKKWQSQNITFYNYMLTEELEKTINSSKIIISRSGYSSIMVFGCFRKKSIFYSNKKSN